jgi:hypothetical protein
MTHEPTFTMIKSTGALRFHHPCFVCGQPAYIGSGCKLLAYLRQKDAGKVPDKTLLGKWRCKEHQE